MKNSPLSNYDYAAVIVMAAAFSLRFWGISYGLPMILEEATPMREAYDIWVELSHGNIDFNPYFFNYPSLTIYLQVILQGLAFLLQAIFGTGYSLKTFLWFHQLDPSLFVLIGRVSSMAFSAMTIGLLYLVIKRIVGRMAGLLAAVFLALIPFHITESRLIQTDLALGFFMTLAVFMALGIIDRRGLRDYIFFGAVVGLAAASKYTGLFALASLVPAHLHVMRLEKKKWRAAVMDRRLLAALFFALLFFFLTSPYCILDFSSFWRDFSFERDHMQSGHFVTGSGNGMALLYYWRSVLVQDLGYLMAFFFLAGIFITLIPINKLYARNRAVGTKNRTAKVRNDRIPEIVFSLFALVYLMIVGSWSMRAPRYLMPFAPFAAGLAVLFIFRAIGALNLSGRKRGIVTFSVFLIAMIQPAVRGISSAMIRQDTRELAREWVDVNIPENSLIIREKLSPDLWTSSEFKRVQKGIDYVDAKAKERGALLLSRLKTFEVVEFPLYANYPEGSNTYYDIRLFIESDYIITSSSVKNRYLSKPGRFPVQVEFYNNLAEYWDEVAVFKGGGTVDGPGISVYGKRDDTVQRIERDLGKIEDYWFRNWKLNPADLHRFAKTLAKSSTMRGNYRLAEILYHASDPNDPEVRYGFAKMLALDGKYEEMLSHLRVLAHRFNLSTSARDADARPGELTQRTVMGLARGISNLLMETLEDPGMEEDLRMKIRAFLDEIEQEKESTDFSPLPSGKADP